MSQQYDCCRSTSHAGHYDNATSNDHTLPIQDRQPFVWEIQLQIKRSETVMEKWWSFLVAVWEQCTECCLLSPAQWPEDVAGGHGVAFFAALSDTLSQENILLNETNEALL
jgi:hypothetical protein